MSETHFREVEKALLFMSGARQATLRAADAIRRDAAESHLTDALEDAAAALGELHRTTLQRTHSAVPSAQERLAV